MKYTKAQLQKMLDSVTDSLWLEYSIVFPKLVRFDPPKIVLNGRFTRCAGCNHSADNRIDLGYKFFEKYHSNMMDVILPHELAHQIDYNLNGWYNRKPHHGKAWIEIMQKIGQAPNPYHSMEL